MLGTTTKKTQVRARRAVEHVHAHYCNTYGVVSSEKMSTSLARERCRGRAGPKETALSKLTSLPHGLATAACGERLPGGLT